MEFASTCITGIASLISINQFLYKCQKIVKNGSSHSLKAQVTFSDVLFVQLSRDDQLTMSSVIVSNKQHIVTFKTTEVT